ncbi:hypothetical protein SSTU70S_05622 [Stutzerimonas stutzeri]
MERNAMEGKGQEVLSYMERNGGWIKAALGCLILAIAPLIMPVFDPAFAAEARAIGWLSGVGLVLGFLCLGYGLVKAGTASARVVLLVLMGLVAAAAVDVLLKWWSGL